MFSHALSAGQNGPARPGLGKEAVEVGTPQLSRSATPIHGLCVTPAWPPTRPTERKPSSKDQP